jgi:hypothetical protein
MLTYTFAQLKSAAEHALGGNPDARISKGLIVNRAINHLVNAHSWPWLEVITTLNYVADENTILLPADFGELIRIQGYAARYSAINEVTPDILLNQKTYGGDAGGTLWLVYTLGIAPQTDTTAAPRYQLLLAPTPAASLTDALWCYYRKLIPTFTVDDSSSADNAKVAPIPAGQHDTLYQLVRAFAKAMEDDDPTTPEWRLASDFLQRDIDKASKAKAPGPGMMRNTGVDNYMTGGGGTFSPHDGIDTSDLI